MRLSSRLLANMRGGIGHFERRWALYLAIVVLLLWTQAAILGRLPELREKRDVSLDDTLHQGYTLTGKSPDGAHEWEKGRARWGTGHDRGRTELLGTLDSHSPHHAVSGGLADPAILLLCYDRPAYLDTTLQSLLGLPGLEAFAVYISQDGNDSAVAATVRSRTPALRGTARSFTHWQRPRIPVLGPKQPGYAWLAQHYRWALDRVFLEQGHSHVVIVEDDMVFSPGALGGRGVRALVRCTMIDVFN